MPLRELSRTPWYQDNLEIILRSGKRHDDRVKKVMELMGNSKFAEAAQLAETLMLETDIDKTRHAGSIHAWLMEACAFAHVVAEATHG